MITATFRRWAVAVITGCACLIARADYQPRAFRVEGLPEGANHYWSVTPTERGWVAASGTGVVEQKNGAWRLIRHPSHAEIKVAVPYQGGVLAAGTGLCALLRVDGSWQETGIDENFRSGIALPDLSSAFVASRRSVYRFDAEGRAEKVLGLEKDSDIHLHFIETEMHVFTGEDVLVWRNGKFASLSPRFPWAKGSVVFLVPSEGGGFVSAGARGMNRGRSDGTAETIFPELWTKMIKRAPVGLVVLGDTIILASYLDGLKAISLTTGEDLWQLGLDHFGGNVWSLSNSPEGLIVGATDGLYLVPDPRQFAYATYAKRDIYASYPSSKGSLIAGGAGIVFPDGRDAGFQGRVISLAEVKPGEFVLGGLGTVTWGETVIRMPGVRELGMMSPAGRDAVVAIQPSGASLVRRDGRIVPLKIDATSETAAAIGSTAAMVGTSAGAFVFDLDGKQLARFGAGPTVVKSVGHETIAVDKAGEMFSSTGQRLGKLPFTELVDAVAWRGNVYALGRFDDNRSLVGKLDLNHGTWAPLDLPLSSMPKALGSDHDHLYVVMAGETLAVSGTRVLPAPDAGATFTVRGGIRGDLTLSSDEDTVEMSLSKPRMNPWLNPLFSYRVATGDWLPVQPGGRIQLARLSYGQSKIEIRAALAGSTRTRSYVISRAFPWWRNWTGYTVFGLVGGGLFWGALHWRTIALRRRAEALESIVSKRTAELVQIQQSRENFFSMLSHEIRNPLSGVVGLCEIVNDPFVELEPARRKNLMRMLTECAAQLRSTVDDVLDFSRIDRGQIDLKSADFEVRTVIEGAVHAVDPGALHTTLHLPPGEQWLKGDAGRIRQVISNFVSNALKYSSTRAATVVLSLDSAEDETILLTCRVSNPGGPMSEEALRAMLAGHGRSQAAIKSEIAGSGLGLAVAQRIAVALGGRIEARSQDGITEFSFHVRLPAGTAWVTAGTAPAVISSKRVLVIEDEAYNRWILGHYLAKLGFRCDWANDGASALTALKEERYDVVITDILLPDMEGTEVALRVQAELGERAPGFIAITAYSTPEKIAAAKASGLKTVLTKPITFEALRQALGVSLTQGGVGEVLRFDETQRREILASIAGDWASLKDDLQNLPRLAQRVHTLRSKSLLLAEATELSESLASLEVAASQLDESAVLRYAAEVSQNLPLRSSPRVD